jgi:hypothetical protein
MKFSTITNKAKNSVAASLVAVALIGLGSGSAMADSEWHPSKGEAGWTFVPEHLPKSTKSAAEVRKEAQLAREFARGKVSPDGWRFVGGERGWVFEGHRIEYRDGKWVHVDGIDKSAPKPSPAMTAKERENYKALYGSGS